MNFNEFAWKVKRRFLGFLNFQCFIEENVMRCFYKSLYSEKHWNLIVGILEINLLLK